MEDVCEFGNEVGRSVGNLVMKVGEVWGIW